MKALALVILSVVDGCTWTKIIEHDQASLWTQPAALTTNIASYFILREGPPGDAACPPLEWSEIPALMTGPGVLHPEPSSFFRIKSTTALPDGDAVVSHAAQMYPIAPRFFAFEIMILASGRTRIDLFIDFANCSSMRAMGVLDYEHWKLSSIAWRTTDYIKGSWPSVSHDHHPSKGCRRFVFERAGQSFVEVLRTGDRDECNWEKLRGGWIVPSDHPDGGFDKSHSPVGKWKAPACEAELSATSWTPSRQTDICFLGDSHISKMRKIGAFAKTAPARARAVFSAERHYPIDDEQFGVPHWNANITSEKVMKMMTSRFYESDALTAIHAGDRQKLAVRKAEAMAKSLHSCRETGARATLMSLGSHAPGHSALDIETTLALISNTSENHCLVLAPTFDVRHEQIPVGFGLQANFRNTYRVETAYHALVRSAIKRNFKVLDLFHMTLGLHPDPIGFSQPMRSDAVHFGSEYFEIARVMWAGIGLLCFPDEAA